MDTARYVMAVLTVVAIPPALAWWYLVHPFVGFWRRFGPVPTITAMSLLTLGGMALLLPHRGTLLVKDLGTSWVAISVGAVLVAAGTAIALARRKQLTTRILAGVPELQRDGRGGTLLTEGVYSVVRHPRYVEIVIITLGYACFANWIGAYVVALLTIPALHGIVLFEERELEERFGDAYREYRERVPRYVPRRDRR